MTFSDAVREVLSRQGKWGGRWSVYHAGGDDFRPMGTGIGCGRFGFLELLRTNDPGIGRTATLEPVLTD